jgi:hypothetical protein
MKRLGILSVTPIHRSIQVSADDDVSDASLNEQMRVVL